MLGWVGFVSVGFVVWFFLGGFFSGLGIGVGVGLDFIVVCSLVLFEYVF